MLVTLALIVDTASTANLCIWVYGSTITHWGDAAMISFQKWPVPVYLLTLGLSGLFAHIFLIYRYFMLGRKKWMTGIIILFALTSIGYCLAAVVCAILNGSNVSNRATSRVQITTWMASTTATDVLIAASLVWQLSRVQTDMQETKEYAHSLSPSSS
ncbi:hypothetical protein BDV98DRAFT_596396 [Pterulicium gracile]|uniref:Uncharacterized protein n=1 Tax=Pterulicium gracile TaxID=1884261 RepID=A0A5C3Q6D7_9AGAR|nr:hypothetical protein BDV98DRAFT_596396 [Pterula gracilis]